MEIPSCIARESSFARQHLQGHDVLREFNGPKGTRRLCREPRSMEIRTPHLRPEYQPPEVAGLSASLVENTYQPDMLEGVTVIAAHKLLACS